jgi:hypothetical protein
LASSVLLISEDVPFLIAVILVFCVAKLAMWSRMLLIPKVRTRTGIREIADGVCFLHAVCLLDIR